jgi:hypothetical protein
VAHDRSWVLPRVREERIARWDARCAGEEEPELGYVRLHALTAARGPLGLPLECDLHFAPTLTISVYAERAREHRRIIA